MDGGWDEMDGMRKGWMDGREGMRWMGGRDEMDGMERDGMDGEDGGMRWMGGDGMRWMGGG